MYPQQEEIDSRKWSQTSRQPDDRTPPAPTPSKPSQGREVGRRKSAASGAQKAKKSR
jgi:hypothetical protein